MLAAFSQFASDLDETTRKQLDRGQRVMELMKQKQYSPLSVSDMAVSLFAVDRGFLDDVDVKEVGAFESALHAYMKSTKADLLKKIDDTGDFSEAIEAELKAGVTTFKQTQSW